MLFRRFGLICTALAMFSVAGGQWAVLQSVAWARMMSDYSTRSGSVLKGASQTFDGCHPCEWCREIDLARAREKALDPRRDSSSGSMKFVKGAKTDKACGQGSFRLPVRFVSGGADLPDVPDGTVLSRTDQPPTPSPRMVG